jgi:heptosyltransferase II
LAARLAGIPERIGFDDAPARLTYSRRVPRPVTAHEVDRLLALAGPATAPPISLGLHPEEQDTADRWLREHRLTPGFVALAPGSVWATKRWGKYPALAEALDVPVVVIGGPDERALGETVAAAIPSRAVNAAGALPLRISAALLGRAGVLVTNDSAPLHMAQATGTPTVALFGPTVTAFGFGPRGPQDLVLEVDGLPCRPCSAHGPQRCPLVHHRCMQDLELARVIAAVRDILSSNGARHF